MKKIVKIILFILISVAIFLLASKGINRYLYGEPMPFNGILVSGDKDSVNEAKEAFKDNTKYIKDYKFKIVTEEKEEVADNGEKIKYTDRYVFMTKETSEAMLNDQILRERREDTTGLESDLLKELPEIKDGKSLIFQKGYYFDDEKKVDLEKTIDIKGKEIDVIYGGDWRIGLIPIGLGKVIVTDNYTYKNIEGVETNMSLIRFEKGTKDYRKAKDQKEVTDKLSNIDNLDIDNINYIFIKE